MKVIVNEAGKPVRSSELYVLMGIALKHLPNEGVPAREIQGQLVKCDPKDVGVKARVKQLCDECGAWVPFSRVAGHRCKKAPSHTSALSKRCPACDQDVLPRRKAGAGIAMSRYANQRICADCGTKEALEGFFWGANAVKYGIAINDAASEYVRAANKLADQIVDEILAKPPEGVTVVGLGDPAVLHNTIAEAVGEPKLDQGMSNQLDRPVTVAEANLIRQEAAEEGNPDN